MSFFDALGSGLGYEGAIGVGVLMAGYGIRKGFKASVERVRALLTNTAPITQFIPARAATTATEHSSRVVDLITESRIKDWWQCKPNEGRDSIPNIHGYWHHVPTKLCIRSESLFSNSSPQNSYTANIIDPLDPTFTRVVDYPPAESIAINAAWTRLLTRMREAEAKRTRRHVDALLDKSETDE